MLGEDCRGTIGGAGSVIARDTPALGATGSTFQHQETTDENGLP